jgi:hypothetical protein
MWEGVEKCIHLWVGLSNKKSNYMTLFLRIVEWSGKSSALELAGFGFEY